MIKKLRRPLIAALTVIALLLPSFTYAAPILPSLTPPSSSQKTPARRLAESRKDDRRQCEAEVQSGTPSFGQALVDSVAKPLKDAIKEGAGSAMPKGVNEALANRIPAGIEQGIKKEIPDIITEGLKRELPLTLGEQIQAEMAINNSTFRQVVESDRFTGLVRASIDESLPTIIQDGLHDRLPNIIDESIRVEIPNALRLEFNKVAQPTIETYYRDQIDSLVGKIPTMVVDEVRNLQATIEGTISGLKAAMQSLVKGKPLDLAFDALALISTFIMTGDWNAALDSIPEIAQMRALIENLGAQIKATEEFIKWANELITNKDLLVQNLVDGFAVELSKSLTDPKAIAQLADSIGSAMTDPINRSLANATERIEASIEGPINDAINGVNGLPDRLFAPIDAALNDISGLVNLEIEMVVNAVTNPIISTIDVVSRNLAAEIDKGLEGVLGPIVGGASEFLGSVGNDIAFQMRVAATETHMAIFGSEGLFIDSAIGEPVWPNGVAGLPEPPTYFPAPGESGFMGPVVPFTEVGPPGPGEIIPPPDLAPLGPLTEATEELSVGAADATIASTETVTNDAIAQTGAAGGLDALSGMASGLVPAIGASVAGVLTGLLKTGNPIADAAIAVAVKKAVEMASTAVFGAVGAMNAVPVTEIGALLAVNLSTDSTTSKILQTSEQIKAMTEKIYSLQVQACTHLKVVQRVQLALEEKELLNDPNARKSNADALYRTQLEFVNEFLNQGREISDGMTGVATDGTDNNKSSLIIRNLPDHINEAGREARIAARDQLVELAGSDPEKYSDLKIINDSLATEVNADELANTVLKERLDAFRNEPENLTNAEFWDTFTKLGKNNIYTRKLKADQIINQQVAAAETAARDEYIAGQGYAGTRECIATTADGKYCAKWQTLTPGSTIGGYNDRLAQAALEQAAASDESIEDSTKSEVAMSAKRVANLSNLSEIVPPFSDTAKQSVFAQPDPCPGPGPCSQTGWPRNTARPNTGGGSGSSSGLPGEAGSGGSSSLLPLNIPAAPPILTAAFGIKQMPTIADLTAPGVKNETIISWQSSNAAACNATNDWPSANVGNNVKRAGDSIGTKGEITIVHPVKFPGGTAAKDSFPIVNRIVSATGQTGPIPFIAQDLSGDKLRDRVIFNPVIISAIHSDDIYRLTIPTTGAPITLDIGGPGLIDPPTPVGLIGAFKNRIEGEREGDSPLGRELRKYIFSFVTQTGAGTGYFTMAPSLTYQLTCTKGEENVVKEIALTRQ